MRSRPARRLGVLTTSLLLTVGLLAPTAASAAPPAGAAEGLGSRGSALADAPSVRSFSTGTIEVRDLSFSCPKGRVPSAGFRDVPSSYPFAKAIDCLVWYEITQGKTAREYAPNDHVTRRQMAVFIYRMLDDLVPLPEPPSRSQFRDVPATGEVGEAINTLASAELAEMLGGERIVAGKTATEFDPAGRVTRAQMGSFIARVLRGVAAYNSATLEQGHCGNASRPDEGCFPDEQLIPTSHRSNVAQLYRFGIVTGRTDGTYGPAGDVTRGQMSAFLMRLMDVFVEAKVTVPPDRRTELLVDSAATSCANADGSKGRPFCSIQAGVDRAAQLDGHVVAVLVRDRPHPYEENVHFRSGKALQVGLLPSEENPVAVSGSIRITGSTQQAFNFLLGFNVTSVNATPAIRVETAGLAVLLAVAAEGVTAIEVDQQGWVDIVLSEILGDEIGVDLIKTTLTTDGAGSYMGGNGFGPLVGAGVYVKAPGAGGVVDANLSQWREENFFATSTKVVTVPTNRRAIVPA